jgi:hypothetical protein
MCGFCNGCVCVYVWFFNVWVFLTVAGVWVICVLFLLCFCIVSFMCFYYCLLLVQGILPPSDNSIVVVVVVVVVVIIIIIIIIIINIKTDT